MATKKPNLLPDSTSENGTWINQLTNNVSADQLKPSASGSVPVPPAPAPPPEPEPTKAVEPFNFDTFAAELEERIRKRLLEELAEDFKRARRRKAQAAGHVPEPVRTKYSPDQERDSHGRFGPSGGESTGDNTSYSAGKSYDSPTDIVSMAQLKKIYDSSMYNGISSHGEDLVTAAYMHAQGFDGKPAEMSQDDMDTYIKSGALEMYRGTTTTYADAFTNGKNFASSGLYGAGTYTAYGPKAESIANDYADTMQANKGQPTEIMRMALNPDAKVVDIETAASEASGAAFDARSNQYLEDAVSSPSRWATMKGYDAIRVKNEGYMVILNRTAVTVQKAG